MAKFTIPIICEVYQTVDVEAPTLEDAKTKAIEEFEYNSLEASYIECSETVDEGGIAHFNEEVKA